MNEGRINAILGVLITGDQKNEVLADYPWGPLYRNKNQNETKYMVKKPKLNKIPGKKKKRTDQALHTNNSKFDVCLCVCVCVCVRLCSPCFAAETCQNIGATG